MCTSGCGGGCNGNCGAIRIVTQEGIQGPVGATGATGATGANGNDGVDGLGYDNMTSATSINLSLAVPYSATPTINIDKAVTIGTRLRYTKTSDLTQWIEGVVTAYTVGTGLTGIDFDLKSSTASGSHTDWSVTVIGEPGEGSGFGSIDNVGTGAEVYKGLNGSVAELRSIIGIGALEGGISQLTDEIRFNPLTTSTPPGSVGTNGNCVVVFKGGLGTSPSFNYTPVGAESLINPGSISSTSNITYYDYNDHIYLVFEIIIDNFLLAPIGSSKWSATSPNFSINGLPVSIPSGGMSENIFVNMSIEPVAGYVFGDAKDDYMLYMKQIPLVYDNGLIRVKNVGGFGDDFFCVPATKTYAINLKFNGRLLLNKN
jgi:hypothetical protein